MGEREQRIKALEQAMVAIATGADMDLTDLHADGYLQETDA
ncbi:hypothetical protein [Gulosibacter massiliensis]|nr:hypothetical protein [Gulosibacter massiliensis]